jgi:hypothetical protein
MNNFDLNIDNYTIKELEDLFELHLDYNTIALDNKESKLKQNIITDNTITESTKINTLSFITLVKDKLVNNLKIKKTPSNNAKSDIISSFKNVYNLDTNIQSSQIVDAGSTNIIRQPPTPYAQSYPSDFYQGSINPLNKRILRQNINIDTRFRENYYTSNASNFHVNLPLRLTQVVSMQLSALELPNTFYVISKVFGNNFFVLEIPDYNPQIIIIPDGNYDYVSLQYYINTTLESLGCECPYSTIQFIADINTPNGTGYQAGSGKMIVGSKSGTLPFSINFLTDIDGNDDRQTPLPLKLGWLMGFRNGYYENSFNYISEGVINLLGPRYIYLVVDDFNNSVNDGFYGAFTSSILNKNILARISLEGSVFSFLFQNNFNLITTPRQYFGPVDIQKLQIQILDEYGRVFDLNNMDYSFCLTFQTIYDI